MQLTCGDPVLMICYVYAASYAQSPSRSLTMPCHASESKPGPSDSVAYIAAGGDSALVALAVGGLAALAALTVVVVTLRRRRRTKAHGIEHVPLAKSEGAAEEEASATQEVSFGDEECEKLTTSV